VITRIQQVFRLLEPYQVFADLGIKTKTENNQIQVPHPLLPDKYMILDNGELVSPSQDCPIIACGLFDYLKFHFGTYEQAVDHCIDKYYNLAQLSPGTSLEALRPILVEDLTGQRKQFEQILELREPMKARDNKLLSVYLWCNRRGISVEHGWRVIYIASGEQLNQIACLSEGALQLFDQPYYVVFPYFKNRHTYAFLQVHSLTDAKPGMIPVNPCSHAYWGLHTCLPDIRETHVYNDPMTAVSHYSADASNGHFLIGHVHIRNNPGAEENTFKLDHTIFIRTARTDIDAIIQAKEASAQMTIADKKVGDMPRFLLPGSLDWKPYILSEFVSVTAEHGHDSPEFNSLVNSIKNEKDLCDSIIRLLEAQECRDVLARFKARLNANQFFEVGNIQICETKNGYIARKTGSATTTPFTNFIIKIDHNIWFEDDPSSTMHCGRILMRDQEFPVIVPSRVVNRPGEIPSIAFNAVMKSGNQDPNIYPQIIDSSLQRKLSDVINQQTANKPVLMGIKRLGWNETRIRFVTPTWEARSTGIFATSRIPYVNSDFLRGHYDFSEYSTTTVYDRVSKQACYFLAILASGVVRSYLNMALPAVYILRNPASIKLLHALFRPFGQVQPLVFGPQRRSVLSVINPANIAGYPVFGYAVDPEIMYGLNQPVILLSDNGLPYHEELTDRVFAETASYSHFLMTKLATFCLQNSYQAHTMIRNEDEPRVEEMVCEGKNILQRACHIENFDIFEPDMPHLQALLAEIPYDRINDYFRYDMPSGKVYIRFRKLPGHSRSLVYLELYGKNKDVRQHGDYYIECPVEFLTDLLERFFGKQVRLFHQASEAQEVMEGQGDSARLLS